ncbi:MAG: hypothetical protein QOF98_1451 [Streptomyces sp.]|nr:hypothetical protein [Streptomyces sp.]
MAFESAARALSKNSRIPTTNKEAAEEAEGDTAPQPQNLRLALLAVYAAVFLANYAMTMPAALSGILQQTFDATGSQLSWISACFFIPTAALELTFAVIGDRFGRKRLLVIGSLGVALGVAIGAVAPGVPTLLVGQAIAGTGAAILFPTTLTCVAALTPDPRSRARGIGMWAMAMAIGAATGPLCSGLIGLNDSYRPAYWVLFGVAIATAVISLLFARGTHRVTNARSVDAVGQTLFAAGLIVLLYGVIEGANAGYGSALIVSALAVGAALLAAFVVVEYKVAFPLIDFRLFKNPTYSGATLVGLVNAVGFYGFNYCVSMRVGVIQDQNSLIVGLTSTIQVVVPLVLWPVIGRLLYRVQPRWVLVAGLGATATAQLVLAAVPLHMRSLLALTPSLLLAGFGFVAVTSVTAACVVDVPKQHEGIASGTINMARHVGAAVGIAAMGAVALARATATLPTHFAENGITGQALAIVKHVLDLGGPVAVAHADLGALTPQSSAAGAAALWDGYALAFVVCGMCSVAAIVIALFMIRLKPRNETVEAV